MFARGERGQSLVEFAIGAMVLVLLLAGIADLGRGLYSYVVITNAAREGARFGASHPNWGVSGVKDKVINEASESGVALVAGDITVTDPVPGQGSGDPLQVDVQYQFASIIGAIFGLSIVTLSTSVQMMVM
jgi:Flp pilus assembly protein TadG